MSNPAVVPIVPAEAAGIPRRAVLISLAVILLLEIGLFSWSFGKFFCGDSIYYLWYRAETPAQVARVLTHPDHMHVYRPLTFIIASQLLFPLFGLNPLGYHFVSLGAHLFVSLLVFLLLRKLVAQPAAALAGTLFFGVHSVNFYVTYDISFLPDFTHGLFCVAALLAYVLYRESGALRWLAAGLVSFLLALLSKESSVVLPVGVVVIDLLLRARPAIVAPASCRPGAEGRRDGAASLLPPAYSLFFVIAALYIGWMLYLKDWSIYPESVPSEPYALTLAPALLKLKLRYVAWFANLPVRFDRRGWLPFAAIAAMLPVLGWMVALFVRTARRLARPLWACGFWALAGLLPALFIRQQPMKHNLYLPVLACAVGLALMVDAAEASSVRLLPRGGVLLAAGMVLGTAFQIPGELKYSWVGEASDIAGASLEAMKRDHPTLPYGALLYVLPTQVKGVPAWYFENGALFKMYYRDRSLKMAFADHGAALPADFASRPDVFIFRLHDRRLWEVTRQYKRDALDTASYRLLDTIARARVETRLRWAPAALPDRKDVIAVRSVVRDGQSRQSLIELPGSAVSLDVPAIPPDAVLQLGASLGGPLKSFARSRISFHDSEGTELLATVTLDAVPDAEHWSDWEVDLKRLAGRQGTLVLETDKDQDADWMVWSRLRIIQRTNPFYSEIAQEAAVREPLPGFRLLDQLARAQIFFDRTEAYPDYSQFATPGGKPVFLHGARDVYPPHYAMVTIAGASAQFRLDPLPPGSALELAVVNLGKLGDGVQGSVFVEDGGREKIFDELLPPRGRRWLDRTVSLEKWAGKPVTLVFQASSGPRHETIGDWCGWARLRIVQKQ